MTKDIFMQKKTAGSIGIAYSPIHVLILAKLFENDQSYLVIADRSLRVICKALFNQENIILTSLPSFSCSSVDKILASVQCILMYIMRLACDKLFIPNEAHFFVSLLESATKYNSLYFIDEGNTYSTLVRHNENTDYFRSSVSKILSTLLRVSFYPHPLSRRDYAAAYVFNSEAVQKLVPWLHVIEASLPDLSSLLTPSSIESVDVCFGSEIGLFFSSPITENGFCSYSYEEIDVLRQYLDTEHESDDRTIFIKPHYRESQSKYKELISAYPRVKMIPSCLEPFPAQVLVSSLRPTLVIGFHSSSILGLTYPTLVTSLSKRLQSKKAQSLASSLDVLLEGKMNYSFF